MSASPEAWLRGPVEGVPDLLQPVAHALLQAKGEARTLLENFPAELLWNRPAGLASVGFHLQHVTGVVDRLFTYARGESLSREQQETLAREGQSRNRAAVSMICSMPLTRKWSARWISSVHCHRPQ